MFVLIVSVVRHFTVYVRAFDYSSIVMNDEIKLHGIFTVVHPITLKSVKDILKIAASQYH